MNAGPINDASFPYNYFPESYPRLFDDYVLANQIQGVRIIDDGEGGQTVYFPFGLDELGAALSDWASPVVNGRRYIASFDQTPINQADPTLQKWLAADPNAVIQLPDGRVAIDEKIGRAWGIQNRAQGDFVQKFLDGPGPVFALISLGLSITALPAITDAFFPSGSNLVTYDSMSAGLDAPVSWDLPTLSPPTELLDATQAPDYPVEPPAPEPVPGTTQYPMPEPPEPVTDLPAPPASTLPAQTVPAAPPSTSALPALKDLPKLLAAGASAGVALLQAQNKADLQKAMLSSPAYLPQNSLLFPGAGNPYLDPLAPSTSFGQTLSDLTRSPLFWAVVAGIGLVAVTRK